jgi:hypothetical protein
MVLGIDEAAKEKASRWGEVREFTSSVATSRDGSLDGNSATGGAGEVTATGGNTVAASTGGNHIL